MTRYLRMYFTTECILQQYVQTTSVLCHMFHYEMPYNHIQLCSQKQPSFEFFKTQSMYRVTLVYTPGYPGRAHPLPQDTTPMSSYFLSSRSAIKGPPLSPCNVEEKRNRIARRAFVSIMYRAQYNHVVRQQS